VVDRRGTPLAASLTGVNRHDSVPFGALVDAVPPIRCPSGRRRTRPAKLHADKADDMPRRRRALTRRRITVRIARTGVDSLTRLGHHRWMVERTMAGFAQFRRRSIRHDRRHDIHAAFLSLGCSLVCVNAIRRNW